MLPKGGRLQTEAIYKQKRLGTQTRYGKWLAHMIKSPFRSQKQNKKQKQKKTKKKEEKKKKKKEKEKEKEKRQTRDR